MYVSESLGQRLDSQAMRNLSGVLVSVLVSSLAVVNAGSLTVSAITAALSVAFILLFIVFLRSTSRRLKQQAFWSQAALIVSCYFVVEVDYIAILSVVWMVQAVELYGARRSAYLLALGLCVYLVSRLFHNGAAGLLAALINCVLYGLLQMFALSSVQRGIREKKLREDTAALNRELIATRELLTQSSAQMERVRIARDLHDILGHHMTALILNLEVAKHTVVNVDDAGEGKENALSKVEQALALAKLLLGDIRTAVSELREDDEIDLTSSMRSLTMGIPDLEFFIDIEDETHINDIAIAETLLRCAQESITNVIRHSDATTCQIAIKKLPNGIELTISDNGSRAVNIVPGNGIKGMQERVGVRGGTLSWEQAKREFKVTVSLPWESSE